MTAYRIFPPEAKEGGHYRPFLCDEKGMVYVLERLALRGVTKDQCEIKEIPRILFDFGGCARINEEVIEVEHNGTVYGATLTQFPWAIAQLQRSKPNENKSKDYIRFSMFMGWGVCMTVADKDALLWKMEQLWPSVKVKCDKAEEDISISLKKAGVLNMRSKPPEIVP